MSFCWDRTLTLRIFDAKTLQGNILPRNKGTQPGHRSKSRKVTDHHFTRKEKTVILVYVPETLISHPFIKTRRPTIVKTVGPKRKTSELSTKHQEGFLGRE